MGKLKERYAIYIQTGEVGYKEAFRGTLDQCQLEFKTRIDYYVLREGYIDKLWKRKP